MARKAFVLAAGLGTRLRPLTDDVPKCLLPVGGRPVLAWWIEALAGLGVREALVNTHHKAGQVRSFVAGLSGNPRVRLFHEPELLGSAGTLAANRDFVAGEEAFWIIYADTLVGADLRPLLELHERVKPPLTLGLFQCEDPKACGIVELDSDGRVISFEEKPARPKSDLAAAGVYLAGPEFMGWIRMERGDLGKDVMGRAVGRAYARMLMGPVVDIGTPAAYERAQALWAGGLRQ
ncbi:MAG: nucleotidyltransferase family protein [Elusimicrobia bacterium]|nr:nucleotidyltransferase family protein [Elusimicrobiota bacterium]